MRLRILPDQRRRPRAPLLSEAVVNSGNVHYPCIALDVSASGLSVAGKALIQTEELVRVSFNLPGKGIWFHCQMELVREEQVDEVIIWGLKFRPEDTWLIEHLDDYVREQLGVTYPRYACPAG